MIIVQVLILDMLEAVVEVLVTIIGVGRRLREVLAGAEMAGLKVGLVPMTLVRILVEEGEVRDIILELMGREALVSVSSTHLTLPTSDLV